MTKASITGRAKSIKLLLAHGADPNLARFPGTADYTPLTRLNRRRISRVRRWTSPRAWAQPEGSTFLVSRGADMVGGTALAEAVEAGRDRIVEYLLGAEKKGTPKLMVSLGSNNHPYKFEDPEKIPTTSPGS